MRRFCHSPSAIATKPPAANGQNQPLTVRAKTIDTTTKSIPISKRHRWRAFDTQAISQPRAVSRQIQNVKEPDTPRASSMHMKSRRPHKPGACDHRERERDRAVDRPF